MRTILLNSGVDLLRAQASGSAKLKIWGFQLGSKVVSQTQIELWDDTEPANLGLMTGSLVLNSDQSYIRLSPMDSEQAQLTLLVPEAVPEITFSNVVLLAGFTAAAALPLCFSAQPNSFVKLQSEPSAPGYAWWFHLLLQIPNLLNRFDFTNLEVKQVEWRTAANQWGFPAPGSTLHDQLLVTAHTEDGKPHPVLNAQGRFWGCPLLQRLDPTKNALTISGGVYGDGYKGV